MASALEISRRFCEQIVLPAIRDHHPELYDRVAVGVAGTGSDVLGLDDEISRDHHWGPRAAVLLLDEDVGRHGLALREALTSACPPRFEGFEVHLDRSNRTGVCVDAISSYLAWFLGRARLPERDEDWFGLCETDLLHVTAGAVFHDPAGRWSAIREALGYYPERVWHKRVADWCMYVTGRDAPYNLHRVSLREDEPAAQVYFGQALRRTMELAFALERRYAPYPKWQYRLLRTLGGCVPRILPMLEKLVKPSAWKSRVDGLIEINHVFAQRLCELGLTEPPEFKPFDPSLTDLTLYASATEIYAGLPAAWREVSFNQIESWEKMARLVLFDSADYFQTRYGSAAGEPFSGEYI